MYCMEHHFESVQSLHRKYYCTSEYMYVRVFERFQIVFGQLHKFLIHCAILVDILIKLTNKKTDMLNTFDCSIILKKYNVCNNNL